MAPSVEEWEALSPAERAEVVAALPGGARLQAMYDSAQQHADKEAQLCEEESRLRADETRRREAAEQEVARLRAALERLKR